MKKLFCTLVALVAVATCVSVHATDLTDRLNALSAVSGVKTLQSTDGLEKLVCFVNQQLDWKDEAEGSFAQRVIIKHRGFDRPTVMVTEGYGAAYALHPGYQEELSTLLEANLVFVEHRYFLESTPQPCDWSHLTVENSAGDYHHIRNLLREVYPGKWFTTGISKGGQTTMFYRTFYPNDVDGSVSYVAPLNKSLEDGRHEPFINQAGTAEERARIQEFQMETLKRRATLEPMFADYCSRKGYTFRVPVSEIFDLAVLEYSFAFWQWGDDLAQIPALTATDSTYYKHLIDKCEPSYFAQQTPYTSFNVQAMRELGYYGYDTAPFEEYLSIPHAEGYMRRVMIPDSLTYIEFDGNLYERVNTFLRENDLPMMFIYGEYDPWSATGVTWLNDKKHIRVFVEPGGSHKARIGTMPEATQKEIKKILKRWTKD
ncbi:MAG: aminopeptidase [Bacteroidaceae bacterium]|nr:aminopeptidase [Bacteroidaceae bacterium]